VVINCVSTHGLSFFLLKSYMFQDQAAILEKSIRTKDYKFNMVM